MEHPSVSEQGRPSAGRFEDRLAFERLISDTSASLLAAPPAQLDHVIEHALERVRDFFQVDRCALLSVGSDPRAVHVCVASYAEGVSRVPPDVDLAEVFPWSRHRLLVQRAPVRISRMADLPPEADSEREAWDRMSIRSALTLPIETDGAVSYMIVLNSVHRECEWPDEYVTRLRLLGEMFAGARERGEMVAGLGVAEARLSFAADAAEAGLWSLDHGTRTFWATARARAIFGLSEDEVVSLERVLELIHPDDRELVLDALERSERMGDLIDLEYRIVRADDGRSRWIVSRGRLQAPTGEGAGRLMGVSIDVTERRLAGEMILRSEARLAAGADLAGLAYYDVDLARGTAYLDDRFRELCGVPPDREHGLGPLEFWMERLHRDDRRRVLDARERLHGGGVESLSLEYRFLHPTLGERWIHHQGRVAERDETGRATVTFGVLRDVTRRRRAEDDLSDLSRDLIRSHEEERAFLARELHDDLTQRLAVLAIDLGRAEIAASEGVPTEAIRSIREKIVRLSEDVHTLAYHLHPSVLEELGLVEALRTECERVVRQERIEVSLEVDPRFPGLGKDAELCLFRVVQAALTNVVRHAAARSASISLRPTDDGWRVTVRDTGIGFDPGVPGKRRSLGLASMRERVRLMNGHFGIESAPGRGTAVVAWVPAGGGSG